MKMIGVLGGIGPQATMDFEARVHRISQQLIPQKGNQGYPPMVVSYFRERPVILPANASPPIMRPPINPRLLDIAQRLGAWADFLVITSNGIHLFQEEIERAAGCKVLSMVDVTIEEVRRRNLKKVGILDFRPPELSVYKYALDQVGIAWEVVPNDMLPALYQAVLAVDEGREGTAEIQIARAGINQLRAQKVDGIVLACTEIPFILQDSDSEIDLMNPLHFLAEATVRFSIQ